MAGGIPVKLLVVRASNHDHLAYDSWPFVAGSFPTRVVKFCPKFRAATFEVHCSTRHLRYGHIIKVGLHRIGCRYLSHCAVVRAIPSGVLVWVTGFACCRRDEAVIRNLNWSVRNFDFRRCTWLGSQCCNSQNNRRCEQQQDRETSELSARPLDHGPHNRPVLGTAQKGQVLILEEQQFRPSDFSEHTAT